MKKRKAVLSNSGALELAKEVRIIRKKEEHDQQNLFNFQSVNKNSGIPHTRAVKAQGSRKKARSRSQQLYSEMYSVVDLNKLQLAKIRDRKYIEPLLRRIDNWVGNHSKKDLPNLLDCLTELFEDSKKEVSNLIEKNKAAKDKKQSIKSVAGANFQAAVAYSLIRIQEESVIPSRIAILLNGTDYAGVTGQLVIPVDGETLRPDADIIIYDIHRINEPMVILSVKTSLRERGAQTAMWRLLIDIAASEDCASLRKKYHLKIAEGNLIILEQVRVGFVVADLYEESGQTQIRGLSKLVDFYYVTMPNEHRFSQFVDVLEDLFK